jgi:predicted ribosomally synthesized peptide with SipW-like signal peptide
MTSNRKKLLFTLVVVIIAVAAISLQTWANFSSTTTNPGNSFAAGTVVLADNDAGSAMFNLSNLKPTDSSTSCIKVSYTGSLPASVRLYGTTGGTGLDAFLDLKVTRGTSSDPFGDCTNFTADATDYIGAGNGVIYNGTLQGYYDNYAAGLIDPKAATPEVWTNGENHVYKFQVTQQDNNSAQSLTATQDFTWQAQNN